MCRLFAQYTVQSSSPAHYLMEAPCSLLKQSQAKKSFLQKDGWGVASLKKSKFAIIKRQYPVYRDQAAFQKAVQNISSLLTIAHLRAASNPLKLPMKKLIAPEHNQPFGCKKLIFAHNGTLNIAAQAKEKLLGRYRRHLQGNNDSEIYFWIVYKWFSATNDIKRSLRQAVQEIWNLWATLPQRERQSWKYPYTGLNAVISDGKNLVALGHSLMPAQQQSLCLGDQPYNQLAWRLEENNGRLIVGSEKFDGQKKWNILPQHHLLSAKISNQKINVSIERFQWKQPA